MMRVEITHRISNLRLWEHDGSKFGDKYQIFLELIWISKDEVELSGLAVKTKWNDLSPSQRTAWLNFNP
jgi:hypothetical protein